MPNPNVLKYFPNFFITDALLSGTMCIPQFFGGDPSHLKFGSSRTFLNQHIVIHHKAMFVNATPNSLSPMPYCWLWLYRNYGEGCEEIDNPLALPPLHVLTKPLTPNLKFAISFNLHPAIDS